MDPAELSPDDVSQTFASRQDWIENARQLPGELPGRLPPPPTGTIALDITDDEWTRRSMAVIANARILPGLSLKDSRAREFNLFRAEYPPPWDQEP